MAKKKKAARKKQRVEVTPETYAGLLAAQGVALLDVLARMESRTSDSEMVEAINTLRPVLIAETLNASVAAATGV